MAATISFYTEKCFYLVNAHSICPVPMQHHPPVPDLWHVQTANVLHCLDVVGWATGSLCSP